VESMIYALYTYTDELSETCKRLSEADEALTAMRDFAKRMYLSNNVRPDGTDILRIVLEAHQAAFNDAADDAKLVMTLPLSYFEN
jgi:hypothetical protein